MDISERQRVENEYNAKMAARRAAIASQKQKQQKQQQQKQPGPTPVGKALINAPSGMDRLKTVLGGQQGK